MVMEEEWKDRLTGCRCQEVIDEGRMNGESDWRRLFRRMESDFNEDRGPSQFPCS